MVTFDEFAKVFAFDTQKKCCIEILFQVTGSNKFNSCWMGKCYSVEKERDVYWFGLTEDGNNAYEYLSFSNLINAPVFDNHTLLELWSKITILEIDGCEPEQRIHTYFKE